MLTNVKTVGIPQSTQTCLHKRPNKWLNTLIVWPSPPTSTRSARNLRVVINASLSPSLNAMNALEKLLVLTWTLWGIVTVRWMLVSQILWKPTGCALMRSKQVKPRGGHALMRLTSTKECCQRGGREMAQELRRSRIGMKMMEIWCKRNQMKNQKVNRSDSKKKKTEIITEEIEF